MNELIYFKLLLLFVLNGMRHGEKCVETKPIIYQQWQTRIVKRLVAAGIALRKKNAMLH
jgi:hypothetical protein